VSFHIGDKVIHFTYGLGEIVRIEQKIIHKQPTQCYVVRTADLTIWVPINGSEHHSLRMPTPPGEFEKLSTILTNPGESLEQDRVLRKNKLIAQMKSGELASICEVIRDLMHYKQSQKLNDQEKSILERAINSLLTEWSYSLQMPRDDAYQAMTDLLSG
jgi:RNA polymerase-interacting CarD/CdnL/TRCF family regulator